MSELAKRLARASAELGLRIDIQPAVSLPDGRTLIAAAHFPDLGTPHGIFVIPWERVDVETARKLHQAGVAVSLIDEPPLDEPFDIDDFVEMFREWGWTAADQDRPSWMIDDS